MNERREPSQAETNPDQAGIFLKDLQERLKSEDSTSEILETKEKFQKIYESLETVGQRLVSDYRNICKSFGKDPGKISVYMVGGRVEGKPLKLDSDIDLILVVENYAGSLETTLKDVDPQSALDMKQGSWDSLRAGLKKICEDLHISNEFHILNYGSTNKPQGLLIAEG